MKKNISKTLQANAADYKPFDKTQNLCYIVIMNNNLLRFGDPNSKLKKMIRKLGLTLKTFTLPAGHTCPGAKDCLSRADRQTGKIQDGPDTQFRCFAASAEATYPSLRKMVWHNLGLLKDSLVDGVDACADLICESLPKKFDIMRVHVGGDYFNAKYLQAWIEVAKRNPDKVFYSYSKSLHFFKQFALPENLVLTASRGGKHDELIDLHGWKEALVVYSEQEAKERDLEIDHDDTHAAFGKENFALLIHGTQPKGSVASVALSAIKKANKQQLATA
ncbi:MAG: hypothetical protein QGF89_01540 [Candidatus Marinimicrobia bacterium]|jgi:hypothetical protein|nr:hypothetical protein [Candidatus Neomarinimicrobiota bacterium]